jgi:hypothetical protein
MASEFAQRIKDISANQADLVVEKNQAYGDSFSKAGDILKILYPEGVGPEQYQDLLTMIRVIDKQFRIATRKDAFGESPWRDINGYSLLAVERDERETNSTAISDMLKRHAPTREELQERVDAYRRVCEPTEDDLRAAMLDEPGR